MTTFVLAAMQAIFPTAVTAQSWQALRPELGAGSAACSQSNFGTVCLMFLCHPSRGLEFQVFRDRPSAVAPETAILQVDQNKPYVLSSRKVDDVSGLVSNLNLSGGGAALLQALASGRLVTLQMEAAFQYGLDGAKIGIERAIAACSTHEYADLKSFDQLEDIRIRTDSRPKHQFFVRYLQDVGNAGQDIANGAIDPTLANLTIQSCVLRCLENAQCAMATYDRNAQLCALQSNVGPLIKKPGTISTYVAQRPDKAGKPLVPGPSAQIMTGLRAVAGEPWQKYVNRLRLASVSLGGNCQAEANEMGRIASTILMSPPELHTKVGKEILVGWTADLMHQRIPAWLVVSVDAPARFEGEGYFALNAGGLGPFGVGVDVDRQRAFVPLFEGDMARKGVVKIEPLEAQTYTIRATLVTYLRACQQEMSLASAEWAVEVAPGSPEIVLREFTSRNPFDRVIEVPEFGRSVVLNDTRFQILNTSDMSEVISREGKELRLSPTKRFLVSHDAGQFEIIDVVDGETVGEVDGRQLAFWNADSFFSK